jgi:meiosis arrest female protein 1
MKIKTLQPQAFQNRYNSSTSDLSSSVLSTSSEKPSFSSLFSPSNSTNQSFSSTKTQDYVATSSENLHDDDSVLLQISNLDQWYDEASLKHYLMNQLKPITPILSLNIETPSIAKVKVPSTQVTSVFY